jgi:hypothetical protein
MRVLNTIGPDGSPPGTTSAGVSSMGRKCMKAGWLNHRKRKRIFPGEQLSKGIGSERVIRH